MFEFAAHEFANNIDRAFSLIESSIDILYDGHVDIVLLGECKGTFCSFNPFGNGDAGTLNIFERFTFAESIAEISISGQITVTS